MSTRSRSAFLAAAASATLLPGLARAQSAASVFTIKLGATPSDDMTPIIYASKSGIFQKHGLDVQITRMTSGAAGAAGLLAGTFDLAKASVTTILAGKERGIPFSIVAAAVVNDPKAVYAAFIVPKESPIQGGKDFNDQLVAVPAIGDIGSIALTLWVEQHGGNPKSIKFVEIPFTAAAAAVDAGRVAAAEISNPNYAVALETGKFRTIPVMDSIAQQYIEVAWVTTKDFSTKNPQIVRAFARAYAESVTYTAAHHEETAPLMAEFTGISLGTIQRMARALAWPTVQPAQLQPVIDVSAKFAAIKQRFPAVELIDVNVR